MKQLSFIINNPLGLISRKAAELVSVANRYTSNIILKSASAEEADLKSIMNVFDAMINQGETVEIIIEGADEDKAYEAFKRLLENEEF